MQHSEISSRTRAIYDWIERLNSGDDSSAEELLKLASDRLLILVRKMKQSYPKVVRWEQTEDVHQGALLRLHNALKNVQINDPQHFFRLAATQIRRELIDLSRKHRGAEGIAANHATQIDRQPGLGHDAPDPALDPADATNNPTSLQEWGEFHELIEQLPEEQRNVVDLVFYHGMSQAEAAEVLSTSVRSVKRWWRAARLALYDKMGGELPS